MTSAPAMLAQARALAPAIRERAPEIERARRLPADLARDMARAGLFRIMLPRSVGGLELDALDALEVIEAIGEADAATGWCLMIGTTTSLAAAWLPPQAARTIWSDPETIAGGVFAPMGKARVEGDGGAERYRVSGRWQWASGSTHCRWLGGGCAILDDGKPRMLPNGMLDARMVYFPAEQATLIDSWHVSGLCGTGSGEMQVDDLVVPREFSVSLVADAPREDGPLYRFPVFGLLALGIAAVMLGNARGAVGELVALAGAKRPQASTRTLAERAGTQAELARNEAQLRSARAFYREAIAGAWARAAAGDPLGTEERALLRLAATHAVRTAADVARAMHDLGGGSSVFLDNPLQRRFRDAHVGTQHMMVAPPTLELAGRVLAGLPTDASML
jgi:alkylation response protein AidB-like acyl-CoA dehydrogenase